MVNGDQTHLLLCVNNLHMQLFEFPPGLDLSSASEVYSPLILQLRHREAHF
jgi:hypothetical protein